MNNEEKEYCRQMTANNLTNELIKIFKYYMAIYDEYYSTGSRDSAFLTDLVDSIKGISACLEVYVEHKGINPDYAIEKLKCSKRRIDSCIRYFESKESKEDSNE